MEVLNTILLVLLVLLAIFLALRLSVRREDPQSLLLMQQQIADLRGELAQRLDGSAASVNQNLQQMHTSVAGILPKLGQLDEANRNLLAVSRGIEEFQKSLLAPKTRGGVGETILEHTLSQMLPREHFALQHAFRNGKRVDAIVTLPNNRSVAVDAKFPLESYRRIAAAATEAERPALRKAFLRDVKTHIDKIAESYILPAEGTLDFALMYIPAEAVYYEAIAGPDAGEDSLSAYAREKRVIPVSPNTLYAYLQTVILGINAVRVENSARQVVEQLAALRNDFAKLMEELALAGKHLGNLKAAYEKAERTADDFGGKLGRI